LNAFGNRVIGDVNGDHALIVQFRNAFLAGTINIVGAGDSPTGITEVSIEEVKIVNGDIIVRESAGTILIDRNRLARGNIVVTNNFVPPFSEFPSQLSVRLNDVGGDVIVSNNSGPGFKEVHSNRVAGTLRCEQNEQPFVGGANDARATVGNCF
jgi:hypothetical protein